MSSSQKSDKRQSKKVNSIVHSIEWYVIRIKTGLYFIEDLIIMILICGGWICYQEYEAFGSLKLDRSRGFSLNGGLTDSVYYVTNGAGGVELEASMRPVFAAMAAVLTVLVIFQFMNILFSYYGEARKIRKILRPLNELALKTDELGKAAYGPENYQALEYAIDHIQPDDEKPLKLDQSEFAGIEAAINNLLVRLRESYKQQNRFVNDASHELRTPIAVIQGYANMLERWGKTDEQVLDESVTAIIHEANHMNTLVEQLLFLARGDSGRTVINPETVNLNDMMREIYEESFMIDENHPYRFKEEGEGVTASADPTLLKQAVRVLVDNAAKYTNAGDEILLGVGLKETGEPYLMVQDSGIGMASADVEHMFERFYRADDARSFNGTGLGLSISKWIIDKHKGRFEILSRPGLGTRILIVLPK